MDFSLFKNLENFDIEKVSGAVLGQLDEFPDRTRPQRGPELLVTSAAVSRAIQAHHAWEDVDLEVCVSVGEGGGQWHVGKQGAWAVTQCGSYFEPVLPVSLCMQYLSLHVGALDVARVGSEFVRLMLCAC
jgi:hypothetical protein